MHNVVFPTGISYGSSGGPVFSTARIQTESGVEQRVARWNDPRWQFNVVEGVKTPEALAELRAFFLARKGPANSFLYKDWQDYHSNPTSPGHTGQPGVADQLIGTGNGSQTAFQLIKTYTSGPTTYTRKISCPVEATVRVWVNNVEIFTFSVNTTTGVVTIASAPASGHAVEASFEFYVPVAFEDDDLITRIDNFGVGGADAIMLMETVDPVSSNVGEFNYGGSTEASISKNFAISTSARNWAIAATTTGLSVSLPDPSTIPPGGPIFFITNQGSNTFALKDHTGSTLLNLAANSAVDVNLGLTTLSAKVWEVS